MKEWTYYVGDPCYVIDDNKWGDFCDQLFKNSRSYQGCIIHWPVEDEEVYGDGIEEIEVWDSPGGDGCWGFADSASSMKGWIAGNEMGVDAGLLAIVPRECVHKDNMEAAPRLGILFDQYPSLETGRGVDGEVSLNDNHPDGYFNCDCGRISDIDQIWDCENCGSMACGWCGGNCDCCKCECGEYYEGGYNQAKCDRCEEEE